MTQDPSFISFLLPVRDAQIEDLSRCFVTTGTPQVVTASAAVAYRVTLVEQASGAVTVTLPATARVGDTYTVAADADNAADVTVSGDAFYLTAGTTVAVEAGGVSIFVRLASSWLEVAS